MREFILDTTIKTTDPRDFAFRKIRLLDENNIPVKLVNTTQEDQFSIFVNPNRRAIYQVREISPGSFAIFDFNDEEDNHWINVLSAKTDDLSAEIDALSTSLSTDIDTLSANLSSDISTLSTWLSTDIDNLSTSLSTDISVLSSSLSIDIDTLSTHLSTDLSSLSSHYYKTISTDIELQQVYSSGTSGATEVKRLSVDQLIIVDEVTADRYRLTIRNGALNINKIDQAIFQ